MVIENNIKNGAKFVFKNEFLQTLKSDFGLEKNNKRNEKIQKIRSKLIFEIPN